MIKGLHKQVVVLNDPECEMFEQVILIMKPDYPKLKLADRQKALREAGRIVENYMTRFESASQRQSAAPKPQPNPPSLSSAPLWREEEKPASSLWWILIAAGGFFSLLGFSLYFFIF